MTNTPELGQRVYVEAKVVEYDGKIRLRLRRRMTDSLSVSVLDPAELRWHPADRIEDLEEANDACVILLADRITRTEQLKAERDALLAEVRLATDQHAAVIAERNTARQELEQLRGEADNVERAASGLTVPTHTLGEIADRLRAALAATAPVTQDRSQSNNRDCNCAECEDGHA